MEDRVFVQDYEMNAIGDAIRKATGTLRKYLPSEMPEAIEAANLRLATTKNVSGENISITDSAFRKPLDMKVYGKSNQNTVPGNQLFDASIITLSAVTVKNQVITINTDTTDYYLAGSYAGTTPLINLTADDYFVNAYNSNIRVTMYCMIDGVYRNIDTALAGGYLSADTFVQGIRIRSNDGSSLKGIPFTIMLNKGMSPLPWEPYVGGTASPNPEYPQPIISNGQYLGTGTQMFEKITSEGLGATLSDDSLTATSKPQTAATYSNQFMIYHDPMTLTAGTTYYITAKIKLDSGTLTWINTITWMDEAGTSVGTKAEIYRPKRITNEYLTYKFSFTPTSDITARRIYVQGYQAEAAVCSITDIMITTDPNAEWEPYTGGEITAVDNDVEYKILGKNLFHFNDGCSPSYTSNGVTFNHISSNAFTYDGTLTGTAWQASGWNNNDMSCFKLPVGSYVLSFNDTANAFNCALGYIKTNGTEGYLATKDGQQFNVTEDILRMWFNIYSKASSGTISGTMEIQVEQGTTKTDIEEYTKKTLTLQTPNGLPGLPVSDINNANYIDADYRLWLCDEIDLQRGKYIQRIRTSIIDGSGGSDTSQWAGNKATVANFRTYAAGAKKDGASLCTHLVKAEVWGNDVVGHRIVENDMIDFTLPYSILGITRDSTYSERVAAMKAWTTENPMTFYAELTTPIERDLTESEIQQYKAFKMNRPNTTILNDANAHTEITYVVEPTIQSAK